ncbi:MAG: hypothetical protein ACKVVP_06745 [Chloroflexota bacterium]
MTSFSGRRDQHDLKAAVLVESAFEARGARVFTFGVEVDDQSFWDALRQQHDSTSLMLRFRPERAVVLPGTGALVCEVKSEAGGYSNFAVEADSYAAGLH